MKTLSPVPHTSRANSFTPILVVCGLAAFIGGCASEPESHVVSAPPPGAPVAAQAPVVYSTPAPASTQSTIVVTQAPPAAQQEVVTARPSSTHVWVGGYWTWRNNRYEWVPGNWVVPPRASATWIPPRWEAEGGAYRFYEGRWE